MTDTKYINNSDVSCYGLLYTRSTLTLTTDYLEVEGCVSERYVDEVKKPSAISTQRELIALKTFYFLSPYSDQNVISP